MDTTTDDQADGHTTAEQMPRKHVYVVNNWPDFLSVVRTFLQWEHYDVTATNFVPRLFETIEVNQPSLLIVDLVPRQQAGWDLLRRLHQSASTRDLPLIVVSTMPRLLAEAKDQHDEFGGDAYLRKPFDLEDLLACVEDLIGRPTLRDLSFRTRMEDDFHPSSLPAQDTGIGVSSMSDMVASPEHGTHRDRVDPS